MCDCVYACVARASVCESVSVCLYVCVFDVRCNDLFLCPTTQQVHSKTINFHQLVCVRVSFFLHNVTDAGTKSKD